MPTHRQKAVQVAAEHIKNIYTAEAGEEHTSKEKQMEMSKQADVTAKTYYEEQRRKIEAILNVIKHLCIMKAHCENKNCTINGRSSCHTVYDYTLT